jgi:hypothetical protein
VPALIPPVALQLYTLREEAENDFVGVLQRVGEIGYVGVELASFHDLSPAELRRTLDAAGLQISSGHVGWSTPTRPGHPGSARRLRAARPTGSRFGNAPGHDPSRLNGPFPIWSRTLTTGGFVSERRCQFAPSTTRVCPEMKRAYGDARNVAAHPSS